MPLKNPSVKNAEEGRGKEVKETHNSYIVWLCSKNLPSH